MINNKMINNRKSKIYKNKFKYKIKNNFQKINNKKTSIIKIFIIKKIMIQLMKYKS